MVDTAQGGRRGRLFDTAPRLDGNLGEFNTRLGSQYCSSRSFHPTMPHFIRLRGPWNWRPLGRWVQNTLGDWQIAANELATGGVVALPGDWSDVLGQDYRGRVLFTRSFRCPPAIAAAGQILLGIDDVSWQAKVELNNQHLGEIVGSRSLAGGLGQRCPAKFDVTQLLRPSNLLSVTVTSDKPDATEGRSGYLGLVRLEIQ